MRSIGLVALLCLVLSVCKTTNLSQPTETPPAGNTQTPEIEQVEPIESPTPKSPDVLQIDTYCDALDSMTETENNPHRIFADTSQTDEPKWREFGSEKKLEEFRKSIETYEIAYNWLKNGRVVITSITIFSGSGDWVKYVSSCYRENGSLARVNVRYRTFYGHYLLLNDKYFEVAGKIIAESHEYRAIPSEEIIDSPTEIADNPMMDAVDHYTTTGKLPYAKLLKSNSFY